MKTIIENIINPDSLVVKKSHDFLKATGLTTKIMEQAHFKFIKIMQTECGLNSTCSALGYKKFLESLTLLEQKAVLFFAMVELNQATHELSKKQKKDKKIFIPPTGIVR